jgi:hypothetical protein
MNPSAHGVAANQSKNPQNEENNGDGPEHGVHPFAIEIGKEESRLSKASPEHAARLPY